MWIVSKKCLNILYRRVSVALQYRIIEQLVWRSGKDDDSTPAVISVYAIARSLQQTFVEQTPQGVAAVCHRIVSLVSACVIERFSMFTKIILKETCSGRFIPNESHCWHYFTFEVMSDENNCTFRGQGSIKHARMDAIKRQASNLNLDRTNSVLRGTVRYPNATTRLLPFSTKTDRDVLKDIIYYGSDIFNCNITVTRRRVFFPLW